MRTVLDTNVLISAFLSPGSKANHVLRDLQQRATVLSSEETTRELREVLFRVKFDRYLAPDKRFVLFMSFIDCTKHVEIVTNIQACRDPKDDKFLSLAVSGGAEIIITGDDDLLALNPFRGITIVSPAEYLTL